MKILFEDIEVKEILKAYQQLLNVRIAVLDNNFKRLYASSENITDFCRHIREESVINMKCKHCDQLAFKEVSKLNNTYIYQCHLGLYESITPITHNNQILGYVMIGQLLDDENKDNKWRFIASQVGSSVNYIKKYKTDFYKLQSHSLDEIKSMTLIMKAVASSIWLKHIIQVEYSHINSRINDYIENHFTENINIDDLCKSIKASRTTVYNHLKKEYQMSFTNYLNHFRLEKATVLLETTNDPISIIASSVGYEDYNYFTRIFKSHYKTTPSNYRKTRRVL